MEQRHDTLEFMKEYRNKKGAGPIIKSLMAKPSPAQEPEFRDWLAEVLSDYKTNYLSSKDACPWSLIRGADVTSLDAVLTVFDDVFGMSNARREVSLVSLDKLHPKLILAAKWQGAWLTFPLGTHHIYFQGC